jgi:hypothetical protein
MSLIITGAGKTQALSYLVGKDTTVQNLVLKLFSNNVTPTENFTTSDFVEVTGGGYTNVTLDGSTWVVDSSSAAYPRQTWEFTSSVGNVYGYYVTTLDNSSVIFAEKFDDGPYNVATIGDTIRVTLNILIA